MKRNRHKSLLIAIIFSVIAIAVYHIFGRDNPRPRSSAKLSRHFRPNSSHNQTQQLTQLQQLNDATLSSAFLKKHQAAIRQEFTSLLNQTIFCELTPVDVCSAVPRHDLEEVAVQFHSIFKESAFKNRIHFVQSLDQKNKWRFLSGEYFIALADSLYKSKDYPGAEKAAKKSLQYFRKINDRSGKAQAHNWLGYITYRAGERQEAVEHFTAGLSRAYEIHSLYLEMLIFFRMGVIFAETRNFKKGEETLTRAGDLARRLSLKKDEARAKSCLSPSMKSPGRFSDAITLLTACIDIYDELNDQSNKGAALRRQAFAYVSAGQFNLALEKHEQSLQIFSSLNDSLQISGQFNNIGEVYRLLGDHQRALEFHQRSLAINQILKAPVWITITLANIGNDYAKLGDLENAFKCFEEALKSAKGPENEALRAEIYQYAGDAYLIARNVVKAQEAFSQALAINQKIGYQNGEILTQLGLGQTALETHQWRHAERRFNQALELSMVAGASTYCWKAYYGKGLALNALGNSAAAIRNFEAAIDTIEQARLRIAEEQLRIGYFAEKQDVYDELIATLQETNAHPQLAFAIDERARSRSFLDLLSGEVELVTDVTKTNLQIKLASATPRLPSLQEIQNNLNADEVIVKYRLLKNETVAFCVNKNDDIRVKRIAVTRTVLRELVQSFRRTIGAEENESFRKRVEQIPKQFTMTISSLHTKSPGY